MAKHCWVLVLVVMCACGGTDSALPPSPVAPAPDVFVPNAIVPDAPLCGDMVLEPATKNPNLLLLVDRSGSMEDPIAANGNERKIDETKAALSQLLDQGDGSLRFGLLTYPGSSKCGVDAIDVGCSDTSTSAIRARVEAISPNGGTPTGLALQTALGYDALHDPTRMSFVVLLTDGKPTCPEGDGHQETQADAQSAIDVAASLHAQAIDTFIVGIGEDLNASNPDVLNQMAVAGGRPRSGASKYYQANSVDQLNAALGDISQAVFGCTFTLNPPPEDPAQLWVLFDDRQVVRDTSHANGWDYDAGSNQVTAYGAACSLLQGGNLQKVEILMGCAAPAEPPA